MIIMYKLFPKKAEIEAVVSTLDTSKEPLPTSEKPTIQPIQTATVDISEGIHKSSLEIPPMFDLPADITSSETVVMIHDAPTLDTPAVSVPKAQKPLHDNVDDTEVDNGDFTLFGVEKKGAKKSTPKKAETSKEKSKKSPTTEKTQKVTQKETATEEKKTSEKKSAQKTEVTSTAS